MKPCPQQTSITGVRVEIFVVTSTPAYHNTYWPWITPRVFTARIHAVLWNVTLIVFTPSILVFAYALTCAMQFYQYRAMLPMIRIKNPFKQAGESEVSNLNSITLFDDARATLDVRFYLVAFLFLIFVFRN
jgi:hypothetical protein